MEQLSTMIPIFIISSEDAEQQSEVYLMQKGEVIKGYNGKGSKKLEYGPVMVIRQRNENGVQDEIVPYDSPDVWATLISAMFRIDTCVFSPDGVQL